VSRLLIRDLAQLATPVGAPAPLRGAALGDVEVVEDAYVLVRGDVVEAVGRMQDLPVLGGDVEELDGRGLAAVPGLVDCHTHPAFAGDRAHEFALRAAGATYEELLAAGGGILSTTRATRAAGAGEVLAHDGVRRAHRLEAAALEQDAAGAEPPDERQVVTDEQHGSSLLRYIAHFAEAFSLERHVANRQHLVHYQNLGF